MSFKETVKVLLDEALSQNPSMFLIDLVVTEDNKISITLDDDNGVNLQDCIVISRAIEHELDKDELEYSIDVASAGVSTPLNFIRQYKKNVSRNLRVTTNEMEKIEAKLVAADDEKITLEWQSREPKKIGKGKETVNNKKEIAYAEIKEAIVLISF
ncbi:ribosome assembly cofactor RimP [Flavobacterium gelidilacus]|uniref:ribosome assembly cofactor RimP n=1 Tax=Flavobacterium gelidilacus TaxID=206041 RepID=UPI00047DA57A|nr:ribosome assembly cofactor RimP [Flavobacterium gelidilacus]